MQPPVHRPPSGHTQAARTPPRGTRSQEPRGARSPEEPRPSPAPPPVTLACLLARLCRSCPTCSHKHTAATPGPASAPTPTPRSASPTQPQRTAFSPTQGELRSPPRPQKGRLVVAGLGDLRDLGFDRKLGRGRRVGVSVSLFAPALRSPGRWGLSFWGAQAGGRGFEPRVGLSFRGR